MSKPRARDLGILFEGMPGPCNAITDVAGVQVGYATVIRGDSIRTGVTVIHPRGIDDHDPVCAGWFALNGNGEVTGTAWVEESGFLEGPIGLTNTHSVGVVRDAIIHWQIEHEALFQPWSCPVVGETADGWLNDMHGFHIQPEHAWQALQEAHGGALAEGNVGGGTGMICLRVQRGYRHSLPPSRREGWRLHRGRARPGKLRAPLPAHHLRRAGGALSDRGRPLYQRRESQCRAGLAHPGHRHRCASPAAPAQAHRPARVPGHGAHRRHVRQRLGGYLPRLLHRQPRRRPPRRRTSPACKPYPTTTWTPSSAPPSTLWRKPSSMPWSPPRP